MKSKYLSIIGLILCAIALTLLAVAHYAYPQGQSYPTGKWTTSGGAAGTEVPEYAATPSPESNPGWVRFLQNNGEIIGIVGMFGLLFSLVRLIDWKKTKRVSY
jgi:hypothetical protein